MHGQMLLGSCVGSVHDHAIARGHTLQHHGVSSFMGSDVVADCKPRMCPFKSYAHHSWFKAAVAVAHDDQTLSSEQSHKHTSTDTHTNNGTLAAKDNLRYPAADSLD